MEPVTLVIGAVVAHFSGFWGLVELAGSIASLICVWLAVKQNIWTWFWGAIGVLCFGPLFFHYLLYSDAALQILFFLPMQAIGWYAWRNGNFGTEVQPKYMGIQFGTVIIMIILAATCTGFFMSMTDAAFPYVDALTTYMSVGAQILMVRKYIESWWLWISMNVIAIGVYFLKGLFVVSGLYVIFLVLAIMGFIAWRKHYVEIKNA